MPITLRHKITESVAKGVGGHADDRGMPLQQLLPFEIVPAQPNHKPARDAVGLRVDVHHADTRAACRGIQHPVERDWDEASILNGYHRGMASLHEKLGGAI